MKIKNLAVIFLYVWSASLNAQDLSEDFSSFSGIYQQYVMEGNLVCSQNPNGVAVDAMQWRTPDLPLQKWGIFIGGYPFPQTWQGAGPTQSWAVGGNQMSIHAPPEGFAIVSGQTFDIAKFVSAEADVRLYAQSSVANGFAGLTLINSEANYREISFRTTTDNKVALTRTAPCDERPFFDAAGNRIIVNANTLHKLKIEYRGPDGGGWRYYFDGQPLYLIMGNSSSFIEPGSYLDAKLTDRPRVGFYWVASPGSYIEGAMGNVQVHEMVKIHPAAISVSGTYQNFSPENAFDGNADTQWNSGGFGPQWIEIDLGQPILVKKIRLLTSQYPLSGMSLHTVYAGLSPNPSQLIATFNQQTIDNSWLEVGAIDPTASVRYIRILSAANSSWVGWREIEIYQ